MDLTATLATNEAVGPLQGPLKRAHMPRSAR